MSTFVCDICQIIDGLEDMFTVNGEGVCMDCWSDNDVLCKGCRHTIQDSGICTDGCTFGDSAGFWICPKCNSTQKDTDTCQQCGQDDNVSVDSDESRDDYDDQGILCHYSKTTGGWDAIENDDSEYMNEPMPCIVCKCTDIPRYLLKWTDGGGGYTDTCQQCDNDKQIARLELQSIAKDEEIARLSAALFDCM